MSQKHNKKGRRPFLILHECNACGAKWEAKFPVRHCFNCGADERNPDSLNVISRKKVNLIKCSDGEYRIPLTLVRVVK